MLEAENRARRVIEKTMVEDAFDRAARLVDAGAQSIVLALPEGHPGVQGICSSRLVESFGRPVFLFSPHTAQRDVLTGSARTVEGVHVQQILVEMDRRAPGLIASFGGHKAAAGAQIRARDFQAFQALFEMLTRESVGAAPLAPVRWTDGPLHPESLSLALVHELAALEPTGRGCEPATFDGTFDIQDVRSMGDGTHLRLILRSAGARLAAVWFRARSNATTPLPVRPRDRAHFLYSLNENLFSGVRRLQLRIEALIGAPQRASARSSVRLQSRPTCPAPFRPRAARSTRRIG
ncbi:MAG: DHHA1 domain-containing protein [Steroidobacteraceae bacterium]